ncbi:MAG: 3-octaprenyl-4-hydroxybenzoate carboxy-lyase, partial [Chitinophagaceae bacterium]
PAEILTIANRILGTGQLSLAKFLFITADDSNQLSTKNIPEYFRFILERIDFSRDVHFYTNTSIDTLDYSGTGLNTGSKVVLAAYGEKIRELATDAPSILKELRDFTNPRTVMPGIMAIQSAAFSDYKTEENRLNSFIEKEQMALAIPALKGIALIVVCDDADFCAAQLNNFLWLTFTRANPSHDIYGIDAFTEHKHWGCRGPLIIDARIKPHHAPPLIMDEKVERKVDSLFAKGGSLAGLG